jgi:hypothetical protein
MTENKGAGHLAGSNTSRGFFFCARRRLWALGLFLLPVLSLCALDLSPARVQSSVPSPTSVAQARSVTTGSQIRPSSSGPMKVGAPTVNAKGVKSYLVTSVFQGPQPLTVRVLEPTNPAPGKPHRLLYVLPVQPGLSDLSSALSDGLEELRLLDVPNRFNMTLIAPSFSYQPWYGDNVNNPQERMESFIIEDLIPFGDSFAKGADTPQRLAIGFSKSGNGVLYLILRHPNVFSAVAAWDCPAQLDELGSDPGLLMNFGTQANFDLYNIRSLVNSSRKDFTQQKRLWISGDGSTFTPDMRQLHNQLIGAAIPHSYLAAGPPFRAHSWNSGWLEGAITGLDAISLARLSSQP